MTPRPQAADLRTQLWHLRHGGVSQWRTYRRRASLPAGTSAGAVVTGNRAVAPQEERGGTVSFAPQAWPDREPVRADITAAVVLDDFSLRAFQYEWNQVELTRANWRAELDAQPVDLLFVESAWHGNHDEWQYQFTGTSGVKDSVRELVAHCRERGVPTVFWNKEDPPHYDDFLECARLFDVVFTTDINKIPDYHRDLGHERVGVLPFAAQPAVHNPARPKKGFHSRDVAFGGMYFAHKFPERREQMDMLLGGAHDVATQAGRWPGDFLPVPTLRQAPPVSRPAGHARGGVPGLRADAHGVPRVHGVPQHGLAAYLRGGSSRSRGAAPLWRQRRSRRRAATSPGPSSPWRRTGSTRRS